eukprot:1572566-Rhodomonas_salina.2
MARMGVEMADLGQPAQVALLINLVVDTGSFNALCALITAKEAGADTLRVPAGVPEEPITRLSLPSVRERARECELVSAAWQHQRVLALVRDKDGTVHRVSLPLEGCGPDSWRWRALGEVLCSESGHTQALLTRQHSADHTHKHTLLFPHCVCAVAQQLTSKDSFLIDEASLRLVLARCSPARLAALALQLASPSAAGSSAHIRQRLRVLIAGHAASARGAGAGAGAGGRGREGGGAGVWWDAAGKERSPQRPLDLMGVAGGVAAIVEEALGPCAVEKGARRRLEADLKRKKEWVPGRDCDCCEGTPRWDVQRKEREDRRRKARRCSSSS